MNQIYWKVLVFAILITPIKAVSQGERYLVARDSATHYFDKLDFIKAKEYLKACISTDDFKRSDYYYLASCFSKLSILDSSAYYFSKALSLSLRTTNLEKIDLDPNLDNLIRSKHWKTLKGRFVENSTKPTFVNENLRLALAYRAKLDQQYSQQYRLSDKVNPEAWKLQEEINSRNQIWLDSIVSKIGWPSISKVGEEGCINAWLIVQHADSRPDFQKKHLAILKDLIKTNDVPLNLVSYLQDRILINECKPQIYGTQYSLIYGEDGAVKSIEFKPIDNSKFVDKRRRYMNMIPLEEYRQEALTSYKRKL